MGQQRRANYGRGLHSIDASELELEVVASLAHQINAQFSKLTYRPPALPAIASKLLELSREPNVKFRVVCALLEQDPLLAGQVLARSQSAAYAGSTTTRTLHDALVRLGLGAIRNLVLEMAFNLTVFRSEAYKDALKAFQRHSLVVAHAARLVARETPIDAEYAFLCGLLHDVGVGAALTLLGSEPEYRRPPVDQVWQALSWIHEDLSSRVVKVWGLPPEIELVVRRHHLIQSAGGFAHPMVAILRTAEGLAEELGSGLSGFETAHGFPSECPSRGELDESMAVLNIASTARDRVLSELGELQGHVLV